MSKQEYIEWTEPEPYAGDDRQQIDMLMGLLAWADEQLEILMSEVIEDWVKDLVWKDLKRELRIAQILNSAIRV